MRVDGQLTDTRAVQRFHRTSLGMQITRAAA